MPLFLSEIFFYTDNVNAYSEEDEDPVIVDASHVPTIRDAKRSISTIVTYLESRSSSEEELKLALKLSNMIGNLSLQHQHQSQITDFFSPQI
jgi:hypothetical protein